MEFKKAENKIEEGGTKRIKAMNEITIMQQKNVDIPP